MDGPPTPPPGPRSPTCSLAPGPKAPRVPTPYDASLAEARELLARPGAVFVDVRVPDEHAAGHPPGSSNVPVSHRAEGGGFERDAGFVSKFAAAFPAASPAEAGEFVVSCNGGGRGDAAAQLLGEAGYRVHVLVGGIRGWRAAGLPLDES